MSNLETNTILNLCCFVGLLYQHLNFLNILSKKVLKEDFSFSRIVFINLNAEYSR